MTEYFDRKSTTWDQQQYRVERALMVAEAIKNKIPLSKTMKALDFGCGTGLLGFNLIDSIEQMTFGDNSPGMLAQVSMKIKEYEHAKASTLLLGDSLQISEFNLIVSLMVLHHIQDIGQQISILSDSVVHGGYICLCDLDKEDGSFHQAETVPHNGFEREYIKSILIKNKFEIIDTSTVYVNRKEIQNRIFEFPVFMIIGRKIV